MTFPRIAWLTAGLLSAAAFVVLAQDASQQTAEVSQHDTPLTFSTSVNLVPVPVVVRDAQGRAIGTLK